jgi:hypothetical protein
VRPRTDEPVLVGEHHRLYPVAQAELGEHTGDVRLVVDGSTTSCAAISALDRPDLAGVSVTAKPVERSSEASGAAARAADAEAAAIRARQILPLPPSAPVPDMLYVEVDGTRRPGPARRSQRAGRQGPHREIKLARLFTQSGLDTDGKPAMDPGSSSYLATFDGKDTLVGLVEAEHLRRGGEHFR